MDPRGSIWFHVYTVRDSELREEEHLDIVKVENH